jgi:hypothetical protein
VELGLLLLVGFGTGGTLLLLTTVSPFFVFPCPLFCFKQTAGFLKLSGTKRFFVFEKG